MAGTVEVLGTKGILDALRALGPDATIGLAQALYERAEMVMTDSKEHYVPVDQGTLRGTGYVALPEFKGTMVSVELGYGGPAAPYAHAVHENPRAGHTGGWPPLGERMGIKSHKTIIARPYKTWAKVGEWKYLETPWKATTAGLIEWLEMRLKAKVRALG